MSGDRSAPCFCGHEIALTRALLDQAGALVECPVCGRELRVWQWFARANKHGMRETNARNTHQGAANPHQSPATPQQERLDGQQDL